MGSNKTRDQGCAPWTRLINGIVTDLNTIRILDIERDRSQQTVQTRIRLLRKEQSDLGLHSLPVNLLLYTHYCIVKQNCSIVRTIMVVIIQGAPNFSMLRILDYKSAAVFYLPQ